MIQKDHRRLGVWVLCKSWSRGGINPTRLMFRCFMVGYIPGGGFRLHCAAQAHRTRTRVLPVLAGICASDKSRGVSKYVCFASENIAIHSGKFVLGDPMGKRRWHEAGRRPDVTFRLFRTKACVRTSLLASSFPVCAAHPPPVAFASPTRGATTLTASSTHVLKLEKEREHSLFTPVDGKSRLVLLSLRQRHDIDSGLRLYVHKRPASLQ